jgi:ANTAR domain
MKSKRSRTPETGGAHRRPRKGAAEDRAVALKGDGVTGDGDDAPPWADSDSGVFQEAGFGGTEDGATAGGTGWRRGEPVARRTATGWRVGDEEVSDLTSAMVLADLLAADFPTESIPTVGAPVPGAPRAADGEQPDPKRLQETVAQLEHALTARVRVEQAIGVLAERHRLRPRQAFELLRSVARARGRRVLEIATEVVDSATNPLLRIPEELAKPPATRRRRNQRTPNPGLTP